MQSSLKRTKLHQWDLASIAAVCLLICAIGLGGASRQHAFRLALVELAALPILVMAASELVKTGRWRQHRFALGLLLALVAIPVIQLIPVPPALWTNLPGRGPLVLALDLADLQPGWSTISLTPDRTWRSALALIPPAAMLLALLAAPQRLAIQLVMICLGSALLSMLLGAAQLASGGERLYPWATTSAGAVSGFFANGNHLATLLLCTLPFALVLGAAALRRSNPNTLSVWLAALFAGLVVISLAAIRSRAGIILFAPIVTASLAAAWVSTGMRRPAPMLLLMIGVVAVALTGATAFAAPRVLARFDRESAAEGRFDRWPTVAQAAQDNLPVGAGLGSFDPVYRSVEPLNTLDATFFNQAHNEYLETWLETGWFGPALLLAFITWFVRRSWSAWRSPPSALPDLERASTIAIAAVLLHSAVDYPLRTVAMATVFAMFCALLELSNRPDLERASRRRRVRT